MEKVFDVAKYKKHIAAAYTAMEGLTREKYGISKFGSIGLKAGVNFAVSEICFAQFGREKYPNNESFIFACYNKPKEGFEAESRRWLEFILDPKESPWRSILPYFVSIDPDVVETTGFIVYTETDCPGDLLYNFLIAARWAYEYNTNCKSWCILQDQMHLSPRLAVAVSTGFKVSIQPVKTLIRAEGYRKEGGKYLRDQWGDKQYFDAEYEYTYPAMTDPDNVQMSRVSCENHTFYSGFDAFLRMYRADPRVIGNGGTFRERKYGWNNQAAAWDIWTDRKPQQYRFEENKVAVKGYDKVNLVYKDVLVFINNLIKEAK